MRNRELKRSHVTVYRNLHQTISHQKLAGVPITAPKTAERSVLKLNLARVYQGYLLEINSQ